MYFRGGALFPLLPSYFLTVVMEAGEGGGDHDLGASGPLLGSSTLDG